MIFLLFENNEMMSLKNELESINLILKDQDLNMKSCPTFEESCPTFEEPCNYNELLPLFFLTHSINNIFKKYIFFAYNKNNTKNKKSTFLLISACMIKSTFTLLTK